ICRKIPEKYRYSLVVLEYPLYDMWFQGATVPSVIGERFVRSVTNSKPVKLLKSRPV
ncbi:hypothetical protein KEM54_001978, partial [Ascosphaera aggregata]